MFIMKLSQKKGITYFDYNTLEKILIPKNKKMIAVVENKNQKKYIVCFCKQDIQKINMRSDFCFAAAEINILDNHDCTNKYDISQILKQSKIFK